MVGGIMKKSSQWWWFDNQKKAKRSPWLHSTLSELDEKTEAMLNLIEQDADSFAKRAEMYYQKRPELVNMVGDFYRAHRLLAERHDQIRLEPGTRLLLTSLGSPFSSEKKKAMSVGEKSYDSCSDIASFDHDDSAESEVDDPDEEEIMNEVNKVEDEKKEEVDVGEVKKLREEIERLKVVHDEQLLQKDEEIQEMMRKLSLAAKENEEVQKEQLVQKDEEKREVIRQLTYTMGMLKEENMNLRKHSSLADGGGAPKIKKPRSFETEKAKPVSKPGFLKKLFNGSFLNSQATTVVAL